MKNIEKSLGLLGLMAFSMTANAANLSCGFTNSIDETGTVISTVESVITQGQAELKLQYKNLNAYDVSYSALDETLTVKTILLNSPEIGALVNTDTMLPYYHNYYGIYDPSLQGQNVLMTCFIQN